MSRALQTPVTSRIGKDFGAARVASPTTGAFTVGESPAQPAALRPQGGSRFPVTLAMWAAGPRARSSPPVEASHPPISSLDQVPRSGVPSHEIGSMGLDHREGFILSLVDGVSTIGDIVAGCGMDELDALTVLDALQDRGLIVFDLEP